jgi:hypothetical protein
VAWLAGPPHFQTQLAMGIGMGAALAFFDLRGMEAT